MVGKWVYRLRLGRYKAGMCDAAWCAPCTSAPLWRAVPTKGRYNKWPSTFTFHLFFTQHQALIHLTAVCSSDYTFHGVGCIRPIPRWTAASKLQARGMTHFASQEMLGEGKLKDAATKCVLRPVDASECVCDLGPDCGSLRSLSGPV